jgi:uncharacterized membrane protein
MKPFLFIVGGIALTVLCWGMYGPVLHRGQTGLEGSKLRALICVGFAYFLIAIVVPAVILSANGNLTSGWHFRGFTWSMLAGAAGAFGAMGIIIALTNGGKPIYVMPMVFGCAPVINVFLARKFASVADKPNPAFYAGLILVVMGAVMVLVFGSPKKKVHAEEAAPVSAAAETTE